MSEIDDIPIESDDKPRFSPLPWLNFGLGSVALAISIWGLSNSLHNASVIDQLNRPIFVAGNAYARQPSLDPTAKVWRTVISFQITNTGKSTGRLLGWSVLSIKPNSDEITNCEIRVDRRYELYDKDIYPGTYRNLRIDATLQGECKLSAITYTATLTIERVLDTATKLPYSQKYLYWGFDVLLPQVTYKGSSH